MENLNAAQLRAVQCTSGAVVVLAGPGSGKTRYSSMQLGSGSWHDGRDTDLRLVTVQGHRCTDRTSCQTCPESLPSTHDCCCVVHQQGRLRVEATRAVSAWWRQFASMHIYLPRLVCTIPARVRDSVWPV